MALATTSNFGELAVKYATEGSNYEAMIARHVPELRTNLIIDAWTKSSCNADRFGKLLALEGMENITPATRTSSGYHKAPLGFVMFKNTVCRPSIDNAPKLWDALFKYDNISKVGNKTFEKVLRYTPFERHVVFLLTVHNSALVERMTDSEIIDFSYEHMQDLFDTTLPVDSTDDAEVFIKNRMSTMLPMTDVASDSSTNKSNAMSSSAINGIIAVVAAMFAI